MCIIIRWMKTFTSFYALTKSTHFFSLGCAVYYLDGWKILSCNHLIVKCSKCARIALSHALRVRKSISISIWVENKYKCVCSFASIAKWSAITPRLRNFHVTAVHFISFHFSFFLFIRPFVEFIVSGPWLLAGNLVDTHKHKHNQ